MTYSEIISMWPTMAALARDLGVSTQVVFNWRQRNNIPAEYWCALVRSAKNRKIDNVNLKKMAVIAETRAGFSIY